MYFCGLYNIEFKSMSNIIEQVSGFLKYQSEVYGELLYVDKDYISTSSSQIVSSIDSLNESQTTLSKSIDLDNDISSFKNITPLPKAEDSKLILDSIGIVNNSNIQNKKIEGNTINTVEKQGIITSSVNWTNSQTLKALYDSICNCKECPLGNSRNNFVFGAGNENADIMVIGEGPGAEEDAQGLPFVGRSGQLLTKILEAINLSRSEVFIANIVKCRPPNNRRPEPNEVEKCEPYLKKQIDLIKPKFILALGLTAVDTLFKTKHRMGDIRGKLMNYYGITTLATYHPAALLRNPNFKKDTWEDVQYLRKLYDEYLLSK